MATVFYRKWRPTKFSDVVGQQHVTDTLRRAVLTDRVAHAYLFTGPRGVGKTSTARIVAKALNAEIDETGDPLPDAPASRAIDDGSYVDLIEIDAASNRGIEDIRELRDRVLLRPASGKFKVYIIDEVHMLTTPAFNALLKTLEEPPPQVVMILATTDIHKVPATIISRCQRYDFRRLTNPDVVERLKLICDAEEISAEPDALALIATVAWGSLRDAENLLEQLAVSFGGDGATITLDQTRQMLGVGDATASSELAVALLRQDGKAALQLVEQESAKGSELVGLRDTTVDLLRQALLHKHGVTSGMSEVATAPEIASAADDAEVSAVIHAITMLAQRNRFVDNASPLSLEVAVLQAVAPPEPAVTVAPQSAGPSAAAGAPRGGRDPRQRDAAPAPGPGAAPSRPTAAPVGTGGAAAAGVAGGGGDARWAELLTILRNTGGRNVARILGAVEPDLQGDVLMLRPKFSKIAEQLRALFNDELKRGQLKVAFGQAYGPAVTPKLGNVLSPDTAAPTREPAAAAASGNGASPPVAAGPAAEATQGAAPTNGATTAPTHADDAHTSNGAAMIAEEPEPDIDDPMVQVFRNLGARVKSVE